MNRVKRDTLDRNQYVIEEKLPNVNVIDLTEDEDEKVSIKKRIIEHSLNIIGHQPILEQPGPSGLNLKRQRKNPRNTEGCLSCNTKTLSSIVLFCEHRFCYQCFKQTLEENTTVENTCPALDCNYVISDDEIKNYLVDIPVDYISYLEHSRDVLRRTLGLRDLGIEFFEAMSGSQLSSHGQIVKFQDADISNHHRRLQDLENMSYVKNMTAFDCLICLSKIEIGQGVVLKNCLHSICLECFTEHVKMCDDPEVICPFYSDKGSCQFMIQEREIRAIVSDDVHEIHLSKALKRAEAVLNNIYHCKSPDCIGFIQNEGASAFNCNVCDKVNCIKCETIHEVRKII